MVVPARRAPSVASRGAATVSSDAMHAPGITRQRRPFLAPIWLGALLLIALVAIAYAAYRSLSTTTVVIVRHAEKQLGSIEDPPLAPAGEQRARQLARMFGSDSSPGGIQAIYVTDARRTQQTAAPLAERLKIKPSVVPARDVAGLVSRIRRQHRGGTVLVVAHGNTVPELIRELTGLEVPPIGEDEYGDLYILSVPSLGNPGLVRLRY